MLPAKQLVRAVAGIDHGKPRWGRSYHKFPRTRGDRPAKASGAVAQAVKAIAEDRNWRHRSHNLRRDIVALLSEEFQQPQMRHLQAIADQLHNNYYEDWLAEALVTGLLADVNSLIPLLWEDRERGPNRDFTPTPAQQRIIDRLLLSEIEAIVSVP